MLDIENGWVADGSTGQDSPYFCHCCNADLGYLDPEHEDADGNPLCESCWEQLTEGEDVS